MDFDVRDLELGQSLLREGDQVRAELDAVHSRNQLPQQGRSVAAASADLEGAIRRGAVERFEHDRDHGGLADGLLLQQGQRAILVGRGAARLGHEPVTRDSAEGRQDLRVRDPGALAKLGDQPLSLP